MTWEAPALSPPHGSRFGAVDSPERGREPMTEYIAHSVNGWGRGYTKAQAVQAHATNNPIDPDSKDTVLLMLFHVPGGAHHRLTLNGPDGPVIDAEAFEVPAGVYHELYKKADESDRLVMDTLFGDGSEDVTDDVFPEGTGPNEEALRLYKHRRESDHGWSRAVEKVPGIEVTDLPGIEDETGDPRHVERDSS